ncbi:MAG: ATP-binding domain-containing protein [Noviherbaspirillum sp.]
MPQILPSGWRELAVTGAAAREIETLNLFAARLPDELSVYHGVHWTRIEDGFSVYGEIDFIIVAPNGRVLLIEQKAGFLSETPEGLVKNYPGRVEHVRQQMLQMVDGLAERFDKGDGEKLDIDYLLYFPDYRVKNPALAGIEPSRVVDAGNRTRLVELVTQLLPVTAETAQLNRVRKFLGDVLQLTPDASAMAGRAEELVTRLSQGLAIWARQLEFSPFRLRVVGTAGSGKTQLALAEFRAAVEAGLRPLYVCYNRPLADHVQRLAPAGGRVGTFHMLCDTFARERGAAPDYSAPGIWSEMEKAFDSAPIPESWMHDVLIIDEGQDFAEPWRDAMLRLLRPQGRALWLEDPMQNLYGRAPVPLPGWVTLHSQSNYRSPRQIVELLSAIVPESERIQAASPFIGAGVERLVYPADDAAAMAEATKQAITRCLGANFARSDIALLSFQGRAHSALLQADRLGQHSLHSFTGDYDLLGNPVWRDGQLLAESVYRFKGQSAPAVIFTEIDFEALDDRTVRKLFVGMTRARLKLVLVMSERAAALLQARMRSTGAA